MVSAIWEKNNVQTVYSREGREDAYDIYDIIFCIMTFVKSSFAANDCISDRKSVLEDQRQNSKEKFYIPECTPDGRYHRVQCYSGYCWCVQQDSGMTIPGTSSKDHMPNCNPVPTPSRPMKGNYIKISEKTPKSRID